MRPIQFVLFKMPVCMLALSLVGCVVQPYKVGPAEPYASIRVVDRDRLDFCLNGSVHKLEKEEGSDFLKVPVGTRIDLAADLYFATYGASYSCKPALSFFPEAGEVYIVESNVITDHCFIELVRESVDTDTGITFEKSIEDSACF